MTGNKPRSIQEANQAIDRFFGSDNYDHGVSTTGKEKEHQRDLSLATSSGHPSRRTITERINGVDLLIEFTYNFVGDVEIIKNYIDDDGNETDLWELESLDVRRQIEHACDVSLERNGRL